MSFWLSLLVGPFRIPVPYSLLLSRYDRPLLLLLSHVPLSYGYMHGFGFVTHTHTRIYRYP